MLSDFFFENFDANEHSHQTLKTAARGKNLDVDEGYLRGILGWL